MTLAPPIPPEVRRFYSGRRACVTGGAGFIGSHLAAALAAGGAEVAVIDDLSWGDRANLAGAGGRVRLIEGSILDGPRRGLRWAWIYFVMSLVTSFGFAMALYLAAQERQLRWNARNGA